MPLQGTGQGERDSPLPFIENALNYISLLSGQIAKENSVLFPMADGNLSEAKQAEIAREFDRAEKEETGEAFMKNIMNSFMA